MVAPVKLSAQQNPAIAGEAGAQVAFGENKTLKAGGKVYNAARFGSQDGKSWTEY
jgi:hypothetical protein